MDPPSLEALKHYADGGHYYSDCAQLALDRIQELESKLDSIRRAVENYRRGGGDMDEATMVIIADAIDLTTRPD